MEASGGREQFETDNRIIARNLPIELTADGIKHLFGKTGRIKRVHLRKMGTKTLSPSWNALISYDNSDAASKAIRMFHCFKIGQDGPTLRVSAALTAERKQEIKKNKAVEANLLDDIERMPGFSSFVGTPVEFKRSDGDKAVSCSKPEFDGYDSDESLTFAHIRKMLPEKPSETVDYYGNCLPAEAVPDVDVNESSDDDDDLKNVLEAEEHDSSLDSADEEG